MNQMKTVLCNHCNSKGYTIRNGYAVNCDKCHGTGIVQVPLTNYDAYASRKDALANLLSMTNFYQIYVLPGCSHVPPPEICEVEILKWLSESVDVDARQP